MPESTETMTDQTTCSCGCCGPDGGTAVAPTTVAAPMAAGCQCGTGATSGPGSCGCGGGDTAGTGTCGCGAGTAAGSGACGCRTGAASGAGTCGCGAA